MVPVRAALLRVAEATPAPAAARAMVPALVGLRERAWTAARHRAGWGNPSPEGQAVHWLVRKAIGIRGHVQLFGPLYKWVFGTMIVVIVVIVVVVMMVVVTVVVVVGGVHASYWRV